MHQKMLKDKKIFESLIKICSYKFCIVCINADCFFNKTFTISHKCLKKKLLNFRRNVIKLTKSKKESYNFKIKT